MNGAGATILVAIITVLGGGLAAWISYLTHRVAVVESQNRQLWLWARDLVDWAYRHGDTERYPLPPPPAFLAARDADR